MPTHHTYVQLRSAFMGIMAADHGPHQKSSDMATLAVLTAIKAHGNAVDRSHCGEAEVVES